MTPKILKTEKDYNEACERIYTLIHSTENAIEPESAEGEEIELLSLLVEKYEQQICQIAAPNPIEAIKFRMEQMGLKQIDIAPLLGGTTRVSEILHGKRPLTLKMIRLLHQYLGVPLESLVIDGSDMKLEPEKKEKLLRITSIKNYFLESRVAIL